MRTRIERSHGVMARNHQASSLRRCLQAVILLVALHFIPAAATAAELHWIGDGGNWSDTGNWATESGGTGGAGVPDTSDIAVFDGGGGDCMIDATVEVYGIDIRVGYNGTVTQGDDADITIRNSGFSQADGMFSGGNTNMTIRHSYLGGTATNFFTLTGGQFIAPRSYLSIGKTGSDRGTFNLFTYTGGDFSHNKGTLRFDTWFGARNRSPNNTIDLEGHALTLNNLVYTGGNSGNNGEVTYTLLDSDDRFIVLGDFHFEADVDRFLGGDFDQKLRANGGKIEVHGDVTILHPNTGSGTTRITLVGTNNQTIVHSDAHPRSSTWTIDKPSGTVTLATDLPLDGGSPDLAWLSGGLTLHTNTLSVGGDITIGADAGVLGLTVADAEIAGKLTAVGTAAGIGNVDLYVIVTARWNEAHNQTYTILSNNTVLTEEFESVMWSEPATGNVIYSENDGKNASITGIRPPLGTVIRIR